MRRSARKAAMDALTAIRKSDFHAQQAIDREISAGNLDPRDAALLTELVYGVLRNRIYMDYVLGGFSNTPIDKIEPAVRDALRIGVYQLLFLDRVPKSAAVNESVRCAPKRATGFVNALLRKIAAMEDQSPKVKIKDPAKALSVQTSHPLWIVKNFIEYFGIDQATDLCKRNQRPPFHVLRVNTNKTNRETLIEELNRQGIHSRPAKYASRGVVTDFIEPALGSPLFKKGHFVIQGEGSQLIVELLNPQPGERILDACCAPGGKTTYIAQLVGPKGSVTAVDISASRLTLVRENVILTGNKNVSFHAADMTGEPPDELGTGFDRVLVDAPCSALGELAKNPDARYRRKSSDIAVLAKIQFAILKNAAALTRSGGVLVYSTCTFTKAENAGVVEQFLKEYPQFEMENAGKWMGADRMEFVTEKGEFLATPHKSGTGGFFSVRLRKKRRLIRSGHDS